MKTAERILLTALTLFNDHGENNVTSVDIAMELDISPGNLYYHFKGKEVIVDALVELHRQQVMPLLATKLQQQVGAEDLFYYLYMLVEKFQLFRFLYRCPADLAEKYPTIKKRQRQLVGALQMQLTGILTWLIKNAELAVEDSRLSLLVDSLCLILTQSYTLDQLQSREDEDAQRYHTLSMIITCLQPRLTLSPESQTQIQRAVDSHSLAQFSAQMQQRLEEGN
ncbi:TetR/AcrR family transcriptional regulator [Alteromonas aestuariivivens]|uniref:TetR/AcrR family transcriptional regulator n=1 Tax=Alteromonas aestuariivivens TaxID=1938339 RepID=A0A3D8M4X8_9ALTE|nr:TetR/AcrR family transcriptional regulator [Alteromonas aestuariivivens]RDV24630.1 TetR/AcrR family transcriptional regulator [Alteromonas aestuariivivens]